MTTGAEVLVHPNLEALSREAADRFLQIMEKSVAVRGFFAVALSGGKTPARLHELLAQAAVDWRKVHIFFSDERRVPPDHPDSNYRSAKETLLSKIDIPKDQIHRIPAERVNLRIAAIDYEEEIRSVLGPSAVLDLIYLGTGSDGHTASLFPGSMALQEKKRLVMENFVDPLGVWRMTFTFPLINSASNVVFLAEGPGKAEIVSRILSGLETQLPAARVCPKKGSFVWLLDEAAASRNGNLL